MTAEQTAINSRALIAAAAKVERIGYTGDSYRFVEALVLSVLADGFRKVEPTPPLAGTSSTAEGRRAARELWETARREKGL